MSGLLDFAQSASNAAASNVSGPVDLITWLLQRAGIPIKDPVGGSAWMARQGLTRPVQQSAASLAGETAGLLSPVAAVAKAPQIAKGLLQMGENAAVRPTINPQTGAIVWHGSPHKFDKFDSSKIGTGEGAQSYGDGTYLADATDVAKTYRAVHNDPKFIDQLRSQFSAAAQKVLDTMAGGRRTLTGFTKPMSQDEAIEALIKARQSDYTGLDNWGNSLDYAALRNKDLHEYAGNLYKVDLPDEKIAKMLDWDKPLSQQAQEVREAIAKLPKGWVTGSGGERRFLDPAASQSTGGGLLEELKLLRRGAPEEMLRQQGIPGVRYLDGVSRGAGTGTSNYVVFPGEEGLLKILERNGVTLGGP